MGLFGIGKKRPAGSATASNVPVPMDAMTHVKGVGRHQQILASLPRSVKVELMPWRQGEAITAKINGERVGEIDYSASVHTALAGMRELGLPPAVVDGEVRRGDVVPLYLAVAVPSTAELKALLPSGWAPAESAINVQMPTRHQEELAETYDPKGKPHEAQVTFQTHTGGKFDGLPEGLISVGGRVIGELSAGHDDKWSLIYGSPNAAGVMVYSADGVYKDRQAPPAQA